MTAAGDWAAETSDDWLKTNWADASLDDDWGAPGKDTEGFESAVNEAGIKDAISYTTNARGETVKVVKKIQVHKTLTKVNKTAETRRAYMLAHPFLKTGSSAAENNDLYVTEQSEAVFEVTRSAVEDEDDYQFLDLDRSKPLSLKKKFNEVKESEEKPKEDIDNFRGAETASEVETGVKKYVVPYRRGQPEGGGNDRADFDACAIRVSNLSEDVSENDLHDLFGPRKIGVIKRIYLAKSKETNISRGFAFITYSTRSAAELAIKSLNRHGYDNRILQVEWSKPKEKEGGGTWPARS
eukprot:GHVN01086523.1.p1 GENE.GHVN01086523.1~~GHVN01086523.1.p1  ORF type:complete len:296 (+),score=59.36 GHVN01086523.1:57-944(+)